MEQLYASDVLARKSRLAFKRAVDAYSCSARGDNPFCGDTVEVQIRVAADQTIEDAAFTGYGCIVCEVAGDMLCEQVIGMNEQKVLDFDSADVETLFGQSIPASRRSCATLVLNTIKEAIMMHMSDSAGN